MILPSFNMTNILKNLSLFNIYFSQGLAKYEFNQNLSFAKFRFIQILGFDNVLSNLNLFTI
jgi:hypothetical protein